MAWPHARPIGPRHRAPSPISGAPCELDGRTWLHKPRADAQLTSTDDLYAAHATALAP
ncbi:hypothetical protein [Streptomyces sp. NPDC058045]|uniref:hypothetical protein n=1 Tax=Streptomyces sp. NPDC058045 TaxID=3346311 RepID=UPI0036E58632